jgi:hypothetical protein
MRKMLNKKRSLVLKQGRGRAATQKSECLPQRRKGAKEKSDSELGVLGAPSAEFILSAAEGLRTGLARETHGGKLLLIAISESSVLEDLNHA